MSLKSSEKVDTNIYQLEITVDADVFAKAVNDAYNKMKGRITLPGFRKGKAPKAMIEKYYGDEVFYEDAFEIVYPQAVQSALDEAKLTLVDTPTDVDIKTIGKDGADFTLKVTVKPEVEINDYKGLKATKPSLEVKEEEIDDQIRSMRERGARFVDASDREIKDGDIAVIDFDGYVDGKQFEGGKAENYELTIGSGSFIPGFEEQLIGHKNGDEFDVNVKFPDEYAEALAGKDAVFKIKVNGIKEKQLPDLDDDFAKDVSEFDTVDELRADLRKQIAESKLEQSEHSVEDQIFDQLTSLVKAEIPPVMIEHEIDDNINEFSYRLQSQGMDIKSYLRYTGMEMKDFRESVRDRAEKQVRLRLAIEKIAELENVEVLEEDIDKEYEKMAKEYGLEVDAVKKAVPADDLKATIKSDKAVKVIKDAAEITEEKPGKKPAAKKTAEKKPAADKAPAKTKTADKKPAAKKAPAKKPAAKKAPAKSE